MGRIPFTVSARTARLIGQENFTNAEGAVIELVKNSYDADSKICIVYFDERYNSIPEQLSNAELENLKDDLGEDDYGKYYEKSSDDQYHLKTGLDTKSKKELLKTLKQKNSIFIIDNGIGMDDEIIKEHWMTIGTSQKLNDIVSRSGRVKAGAKGIGRFSLDRLGNKGKMITYPLDKDTGYNWRVRWSDFEKEGAKIEEVEAYLDEINSNSYKEIIKDLTQDERINSIVENEDNKFSNGTLLKISELRDDWDLDSIESVFRSLEILTPPEGQEQFNIYLYSNSNEEKEFGLIDNAEFLEYDYKLECEYLDDEERTLKLEIFRDEFDKENIDKDLFDRDEMQKFPYDKETFDQDSFTIETTIYELLPGLKKKESNLIDGLGPFSFNLYFLKRNQPGSDKQDKYYYKNINPSVRSQWLNKFGGIRIFKDGFRVRPYGESNSSYADWLGLGDRYASNPAAVSRKGQWKVRPGQVAGSIKISRISNLSFQEKSSREGFQENVYFELFKNVIKAIINRFEEDRSTIAYNLDQLHKDKNEEERAEEEADKTLEKEEKEQTSASEKTREELEKDYENFKKGYKSQKRKLEEKDEELKLSRALASAGLMIASFTHEFKAISRKLSKRAFELKKYLKELLPPSEIDVPDYENPYSLIEEMRNQDKKLKQWIDFSLSLVQKDKRRAKSVDLKEYFNRSLTKWEDRLATRDIDISFEYDFKDYEYVKMRIYELDMDSIFDNLIVNSVEAFQVSGYNGDRNINVAVTLKNEDILIEYRDSGPGIDESFEKNPEQIFKPFETSKRDDQGNPTGTGLGMWIVKSIIDEYKGSIKLQLDNGFGVDLMFRNRVYKTS